MPPRYWVATSRYCRLCNQVRYAGQFWPFGEWRGTPLCLGLADMAHSIPTRAVHITSAATLAIRRKARPKKLLPAHCNEWRAAAFGYWRAKEGGRLLEVFIFVVGAAAIAPPDIAKAAY